MGVAAKILNDERGRKTLKKLEKFSNNLADVRDILIEEAKSIKNRKENIRMIKSKENTFKILRQQIFSQDTKKITMPMILDMLSILALDIHNKLVSFEVKERLVSHLKTIGFEMYKTNVIGHEN